MVSADEPSSAAAAGLATMPITNPVAATATAQAASTGALSRTANPSGRPQPEPALGGDVVAGQEPAARVAPGGQADRERTAEDGDDGGREQGPRRR